MPTYAAILTVDEASLGVMVALFRDGQRVAEYDPEEVMDRIALGEDRQLVENEVLDALCRAVKRVDDREAIRKAIDDRRDAVEIRQRSFDAVDLVNLQVTGVFLINQPNVLVEAKTGSPVISSDGDLMAIPLCSKDFDFWMNVCPVTFDLPSDARGLVLKAISRAIYDQGYTHVCWIQLEVCPRVDGVIDVRARVRGAKFNPA